MAPQRRDRVRGVGPWAQGMRPGKWGWCSTAEKRGGGREKGLSSGVDCHRTAYQCRDHTDPCGTVGILTEKKEKERGGKASHGH